jgi:hypothetical protein
MEVVKDKDEFQNHYRRGESAGRQPWVTPSMYVQLFQLLSFI